MLIGGRPDTAAHIPSSLRRAAYRIAVKLDREGRGGSAYMWSLKVGARLIVSNPRSNFPLDYARPDYLLIAGGIGITPIYGMALALAQHGADVLGLCGAHVEELAFAGELRGALGERLITFVSAQGQRLDLAGLLGGVAPGGLAMLCGPLPMLDEARRVWKRLGRPAIDLRFETFGSSGTHAPEAFQHPRRSSIVKSWCRKTSRCSMHWPRRV